MTARFRDLVTLEARLASARAGVEGQQARRELVEFQLEELRRAELAEGDGEEMERERDILRHAEHLRVAAAEAEDALQSRDGAMVDTVGRLANGLTALASLDPELGEAGRLLEEARPSAGGSGASCR